MTRSLVLKGAVFGEDGPGSTAIQGRAVALINPNPTEEPGNRTEGRASRPRRATCPDPGISRVGGGAGCAGGCERARG